MGIADSETTIAVTGVLLHWKTSRGQYRDGHRGDTCTPKENNCTSTGPEEGGVYRLFILSETTPHADRLTSHTIS